MSSPLGGQLLYTAVFAGYFRRAGDTDIIALYAGQHDTLLLVRFASPASQISLISRDMILFNMGADENMKACDAERLPRRSVIGTEPASAGVSAAGACPPSCWA